MALHLCFANRVEPLVASLSRALDGFWTDLAFPPEVVVPSPAVSKWLKLRLCERRGALLNLPTPTLEGFLWRSLEPGDLRFLKGPALSQALVPLLDRERLSDPRYAPVREFLVREGTIDPRRRLQLAQELARLFLEYEYNRPSVWSDGRWAVEGIDRHWPTRTYFDPAGENASEAWQRDLYGAVFASETTLAREGYCSLPGLHRCRREEGWRPQGAPVLVFLVDKVSHFHRNLLMELSQGREIHLFLQNPCAEFWEDLDTRRRPATRCDLRLPRFRPEDYQAESLSPRLYPAGPEEADPLLLTRWGHTARENISLWSQAADYAFDFLVDPPLPAGGEPTVLSVLQQGLLQRHPGPGARPLDLEDGQILSNVVPPDESVTLLAAPERGREMEAVRDQILQWLSEDPSRSPSDCLVLLADPSRHRTEIHRVFGGVAPGEPGWIPWAFLGEPGRESRFARGVEAIGALLLFGMDRPGVFELFRNPLCRLRLGIEAETVLAWERWAEGSGMLRGWDAADRAGRGDQEPWDSHTFRAGILRLYAARLAAGDLSLSLRVAADQVRLPGWRDFESSDPMALDGFVGALERLHVDLEALKAKLPGRDLAFLSEEFLALCETWLEPDGPEESQVRKAWRQGMGLLALQAGRAEPMELDELVDAVKGFLPDELPGSARAFAGALTFAPLRISNLVPHELVVVAGLESDAFPRAVQKTSLDLLGTRRLVGDADPLQDDRHTFLSVVLSARSRLVLSWRAEDLQKDREIEPSSVLQELRAALGAVTDSVTEHSVRLLAREPGIPRKGRLPSPVESWDPSDAVDPVSASGAVAWERMETADQGKDVRRVSLAQLRGFLENPYLRHLRQVLGFEEEDGPDTVGSAEEALESDALHAAGVRQAIFDELVSLTWGGEGEVDAAVSRILARAAWDGYAPEGELLRLEHVRLRTWAGGLAHQLRRLREGWPVLHCRTDLSLGRSGRDPVVVLEAGGARVELTGSVPLVLEGERGVAVLALSRLSLDKGSKELRADVRRRLEAWLQAAALRAAGEESVWTVQLSRELPDDPDDAVAWQAWERPQGDLLRWLQELVEDLVAGCREFLPAREVLGGKRSLDELREAIETGDYPDSLERLFRPALPGEDEMDQGRMDALLMRRLGPFLGGKETDGNA